MLRAYRETVDSRWMFPSPVKEDVPMTPGAVRRRLQIILERAGCKRIRFHDLRHTFATLSLENGMDVKTLSAMLGHVSAATTLDIYTHVTGDMQTEAAAKIDRGLGNEVLESPEQAAPVSYTHLDVYKRQWPDRSKKTAPAKKAAELLQQFSGLLRFGKHSLICVPV